MGLLHDSPHPHPPELGLYIGIGLQGDFQWVAGALACEALSLGPSIEVAGGFDGHDGALGRSDFKAQGSVGFRGWKVSCRCRSHCR